MRAAFLLCATACLVPLAGCSRSSDGSAKAVRPVPVVVYVASEDDGYLTDLVRDYRDASGTVIIVRRGPADSIVTDQIANRVEPPADVLITRSVADIRRAADHGSLRPLAAAGVEPPVPDWLRDAEGYWAALGEREAVIAYDPDSVGMAAGTGYAMLAEPRFGNRLCLTSSRNPVNLAVIAQLIAAQGVRPAELVVRGWISNLARPVFESDAEVVAAIAAGTCGIGIVSSAAMPESGGGIAVAVPSPAYADADAVGIGRHAHNPDGAAAFVEWLFRPEIQQRLATKTLDYPANPRAKLPERLPDTDGRDATLASRYIEDAVKLAVRAHYP